VGEQKLYMIRAEISRARLFQLGKQLGYPLERIDTGYLVHTALRLALGEHAPQPFSVRPGRGPSMVVLGYARRDSRALLDVARAVAEPVAYAAVSPETLLSKPLPNAWSEGQKLAFEVRFCPIVRKAKAGEHHAAGAEVDVFIDRCWKMGEGVAVDREEIYRNWLRERFDRSGAAEIDEVQLTQFKLERLSRRDTGNGRKWSFRDRPDATVTGTLRVRSPATFDEFLARGVGRHRAFGFGMILLRSVVQC